MKNDVEGSKDSKIKERSSRSSFSIKKVLSRGGINGEQIQKGRGGVRRREKERQREKGRREKAKKKCQGDKKVNKGESEGNGHMCTYERWRKEQAGCSNAWALHPGAHAAADGRVVDAFVQGNLHPAYANESSQSPQTLFFAFSNGLVEEAMKDTCQRRSTVGEGVKEGMK